MWDFNPGDTPVGGELVFFTKSRGYVIEVFRKEFGFAYPTPQPPENTLVFFSLLTQFGSVRTTHKRVVYR